MRKAAPLAGPPVASTTARTERHAGPDRVAGRPRLPGASCSGRPARCPSTAKRRPPTGRRGARARRARPGPAAPSKAASHASRRATTSSGGGGRSLWVSGPSAGVSGRAPRAPRRISSIRSGGTTRSPASFSGHLVGQRRAVPRERGGRNPPRGGFRSGGRDREPAALRARARAMQGASAASRTPRQRTARLNAQGQEARRCRSDAAVAAHDDRVVPWRGRAGKATRGSRRRAEGAGKGEAASWRQPSGRRRVRPRRAAILTRWATPG